MLETAISFLNHRKNQEAKVLNKAENNAIDTILTVEINITELCNRKCVFCPRIDPEIYPNRKEFISDQVFQKIISELVKVNYKGKISFSGFGEPLLNKQFINLIKYCKSALPENIIETNTNGDKLTANILKELFDAGLSAIYWNLYDSEQQIKPAEKLISESGIDKDLIHLRPHWPDNKSEKNNWGLFLNNRSGAIKTKSETKYPLKKICNYPFYKLFIDFNGDVLCCSNDWLRKNIIGNIMTTDIESIWLNSNWNIFRKSLLEANRDQLPCATCDIDGTLFGNESRERLSKFIK